MKPLLTAPRIDGLILGEGVILLDFDAAKADPMQLPRLVQERLRSGEGLLAPVADTAVLLRPLTRDTLGDACRPEAPGGQLCGGCQAELTGETALLTPADCAALLPGCRLRRGSGWAEIRPQEDGVLAPLPPLTWVGRQPDGLWLLTLRHAVQTGGLSLRLQSRDAARIPFRFLAAGEEAFSLLWVETADEGSLAGEEANAG